MRSAVCNLQCKPINECFELVSILSRTDFDDHCCRAVRTDRHRRIAVCVWIADLNLVALREENFLSINNQCQPFAAFRNLKRQRVVILTVRKLLNLDIAEEIDLSTRIAVLIHGDIVSGRIR